MDLPCTEKPVVVRKSSRMERGVEPLQKKTSVHLSCGWSRELNEKQVLSKILALTNKNLTCAMIFWWISFL